ncbi:DUF4209 domain-containing protein [Corallibacter vietnamensis]
MLDDIYIELENDYHLETNILKKIQSFPNADDCSKIKAEILGFQFMENNLNNSDWGTYFGPYASFPKENGILFEIPSIKDVNKDVIDYWEERISQVVNPVLKARYAGLVWDFTSKIIFRKPSHHIALIYIESLIRIVEDRLQNGIDLVRKIKRAISVAISINNKELINKCKEAILVLEDEIGENDKPGLWGFSFDILISNPKIQLSELEKSTILQKLEQRLVDVTSESELNTWASECVIKRLAQYYRKKNKLNDAHRVLRIHGDVIKNKKEYALILQYQGALKNLQKLYSEYGMKNESDELLIEIKNIGAKILDEMQLTTSEIQITKEEIDKIVIPITTGTKNEVFHRLIHFFTPQIDHVTQCLKESAKEHILSNFFGKSIIDETGREIANIGTLEEDLIGNILHYISEDFQYYSIYSNKIFYRLINELNYTVDDFINFIKDSVILSESRINVIRKGVQAYFDDDFIICEHLLIPQIETSIRNLIEQNNGVVLEPSSMDAFQLKTFNKLLLDDIVKYTLGKDIQIYFRAMYTDPRGWNLRNKICHGLSDPDASSRSTSERVLHTLLIIGTLRRIKNK